MGMIVMQKKIKMDNFTLKSSFMSIELSWVGSNSLGKPSTPHFSYPLQQREIDELEA